AARPDPGGKPRPDARSREVRLAHGLQAVDVRDLVDPAVGDACARRPGPDDPPAGARRRTGAAPDARPPGADAEAEPRARTARTRQGERLHREEGARPARADRGSDLAGGAGR